MVWLLLQNSHVALALCQPDAVEMFAQRHGKLSGRAEQVADFRNGGPLPCRQAFDHFPVHLLARVVVKIGEVESVHPGVIERLFATDLAFLQDLYRRVNSEGHTHAAVTCPSCGADVEVDVAGDRPGES